MRAISNYPQTFHSTSGVQWSLGTVCKYFERRLQEILLLGGGGLGDSPSELNAGSPALELNFFSFLLAIVEPGVALDAAGFFSSKMTASGS